MATISLEIPTDQLPRLKAFIDNIDPLMPGDPARTDAQYLTIFRAYLRALIVRDVRRFEWQQTLQTITDIQVQDA